MCALVEEICTVKTSDRSKMNPKKNINNTSISVQLPYIKPRLYYQKLNLKTALLWLLSFHWQSIVVIDIFYSSSLICIFLSINKNATIFLTFYSYYYYNKVYFKVYCFYIYVYIDMLAKASQTAGPNGLTFF